MTPLGDLDPQTFLDKYWQKAPLLIRQAFPSFTSPIDADELAGLACEDDVESRIVITHAGPRYELLRGPFTDSDFAARGAHDWTLLVQDVDKHLEGFAAFLDYFSFIPAWRMDDLMISWAADGGSVGPHVDQYDVFLLQAVGYRRWRVGPSNASTAFLPDHELKVLSEFEAVDEWLLEPGDMLYLPPGIPHWGIAEGECMTWSVGFRAPAGQELVHDFADQLATLVGDQLRYQDMDLSIAEADGGQVSAAAVERFARILDAAYVRGRSELPFWLGEMLTSPKMWLQAQAPEKPCDAATLSRSIAGGRGLIRDPRARLAWIPMPDRGLVLFCDGHGRAVPTRLGGLLAELCTAREFPPERLTRYLEDDEAIEVLLQLVNGGQLVMNDDD